MRIGTAVFSAYRESCVATIRRLLFRGVPLDCGTLFYLPENNFYEVFVVFQKNDRFLFAARIVFIVLTVIGVLVSMIYPIYWAIKTENGFYAFYIVLYFAPCVVFVVFWNLFLAFLVDVKLIRNKLYQEDNTTFCEFIGNVHAKTEVLPEAKPQKKEHEDQSDFGVYDD